MKYIALLISALLISRGLTLSAQDNSPQLAAKDLLDLETRITQLMESVALAVPGLATAAAPVRQTAEASIAAQRTNSGSRSLSFRASTRSFLLPAFSSAFFRGSHTTTLVTRGLSKSYSQAALIPSSKVTHRLPRSPWMNSRTVAAFVFAPTSDRFPSES